MTNHPDGAARLAVVVGLCAHGLAVTRALARQGVPTHVLEANRALPGTRTRHAAVHFTADINGPGLISALLDLRGLLGCRESPVLFLTNDNMVTQVALRWEELAPHYRLSWSGCRDTIRRLVDKSAIEARCEEVGLRYPRTWQLPRREALEALAPKLSFPVIAKPARPLSAFKVRVLDSVAGLASLVDDYADQLPFLVQDWIPGDETHLGFCALYLDRGRELGRFDGRKLRARPMGHTTIAEPVADEAVHRATRRFFDGLDVSGPVSLELKRDDAGELWVIEPTMGRTDFWLGCCIANGINLPYIEYCHQAGIPLAPAAQRQDYVWFNMDRDPASPFWYAWQVLHGAVQPRAGTFLYVSQDDIRPFVSSLAANVVGTRRRVTARVRREVQPRISTVRSALQGFAQRSDRGGQPQAVPGTVDHGAGPESAAVAGGASSSAALGAGWDLVPAAEFWRYRDAWQELNALASRSPLLDPDFVAPLLTEFGSGDEMLALLPGAESLQAAALIAPQGPGLWETFQPSQSPIGTWLQNGSVPTVALIDTLFDSLPGLPLRVGITQLDPDLLPRPPEARGATMLDYIQTARVPIEGDFERYWAERGRNLRHNMKRQRRRLETDGVATCLEVLTAPEAMAGAIADYGVLESAGWKAAGGTAVGSDNAQGRFYRAVLENFARRGRARVYRYRFDGKVVAMDLCIEGEGDLIILKTAYDESVSAVSPAFLMREESFRGLFDEGRIRRVEFYGKLMDWHTKWTHDVRTMYHLTYYRWPFLAKLREATYRILPPSAVRLEPGSVERTT